MVYLIPSFLSEDAVRTIPPYVMDAVRTCTVIFAENERTARRFLKSMDRTVDIDSFEWHTIHKSEAELLDVFRERIREGKNIAVISEAGCPGIADPGQRLVYEAQLLNAEVRPLVGPSSIVLALMSSGLNGQQFSFLGYLPIDNGQRIKRIRQIEEESKKRNSTQIFIETPYRNNGLLQAILEHTRDTTLLCIAAELTAEGEWVKTKTVAIWKKEKVDLHKKPVIFLLLAT